MNFHIAEVTKNKTTKCPNNFDCLSCEESPLCKAERHIRYNGLVVKPSSEIRCPYLSVIDSSIRCNCPVRIEIFLKYNK